MSCPARADGPQRIHVGPGGACLRLLHVRDALDLNIVTEAEGFPAAVLIRALFPDEGLPSMRRRRRGSPDVRLTDGPAKLCRALGINRSFDGVDLCRAETRLFLESLPQVDEASVTRGPRVGLNTVPEPWQSVPWPFRVRPAILQGLFKED